MCVSFKVEQAGELEAGAHSAHDFHCSADVLLIYLQAQTRVFSDVGQRVFLSNARKWKMKDI